MGAKARAATVAVAIVAGALVALALANREPSRPTHATVRNVVGMSVDEAHAAIVDHDTSVFLGDPQPACPSPPWIVARQSPAADVLLRRGETVVLYPRCPAG